MGDEEASIPPQQDRGRLSQLYESFVLKPSRSLFATFSPPNNLSQIQKIAAHSKMTDMNSNALHFCIKFRLEGNQGIKYTRIAFDPLLDSMETLVDAVLEKFIPEGDKPVVLDDYEVKLKDLCDEWPIDVDSNEDLALAVNTTTAKADGFVKMSATIRRKSDPPIIMLDPEPISISPPSTVVTIEKASPASGKRKATAAKKKSSPAKKRRASVGMNLPVRARIIRAVAELHALGKDKVPRAEVALFAGYTNAASKGFSNPLSSLKTEGILDYPDKKTVALTPMGLETEEARAITPPTDNREVQARLRALLTPKQAEIFDILAKSRKPRLRDEIAATVGYTNPASKGFSNSVGKMSSLGIIWYPKDDANPKVKWVALTDMCFPFPKEEDDGIAAFRTPTPPPAPAPALPPAAGGGTGAHNYEIIGFKNY
mmetsp:Transcript_26327/g.58510  ORF Transcript_26327/g.58510 Transcript_26327/m.58510 type:complete len:428 (-) Transcript_26327:147-1430(-)